METVHDRVLPALLSDLPSTKLFSELFFTQLTQPADCGDSQIEVSKCLKERLRLESLHPTSDVLVTQTYYHREHRK